MAKGTQVEVEFPSEFFLSDEELTKSQKDFEEIAINLAISLLNKLFPNDDNRDVAEDSILRGDFPEIESDTPTDEEIDVLDKLRILHEGANKSCTYLMLGAPSKNWQASYIKEVCKRQAIFKNFDLEFSGSLSDYDLSCSRVYEKVDSLDQAKESIRKFVNSDKYLATVVYIIFTGHGNPKGVNFEDGPASFHEFLSYVSETTNRRYDFAPRLMKVLFSQCHGYKWYDECIAEKKFGENSFTKKSFDNVAVKTLTSERQPTTLVRHLAGGDYLQKHLQKDIPDLVEEANRENETDMDVNPAGVLTAVKRENETDVDVTPGVLTETMDM